MVIGTVELHLHLEHCSSLKDKRSRLRGAIEKARRELHVSAAEVDDQDLWNVATVGIAVVSNDPVIVEAVLTRAEEFFETGEMTVEQAVRSVERS
jgi:uncharacterized protein YlxP (DUF503 family)